MERTETTSRTGIAGRIEVLPRAIASIAARAAAQTSGVFGLVSHEAQQPAADALSQESAWRGVAVSTRSARPTIEVFLLVEYGAPITTVAAHVQEHVHSALQQALGEAPEAVHVRVQGLRGRR